VGHPLPTRSAFSCTRPDLTSLPSIPYYTIPLSQHLAVARANRPLIHQPSQSRYGSLRSKSRHCETRCARRSEPPPIDQHAHTLAVHRIYNLPLARRAVVLAPPHNGPPSSNPSGRATTPRPPTRVFESDIPTAISHAHRSATDANTLCGSLLARPRSVSTRTTWEERQFGTRPARVATRTRYVQESVTQA